METKAKKRNSYIELERFLAALGILFYHVGFMKSGWIFVEFFFMLSGYFAMRHFSKLSDSSFDGTTAGTWYPLKYTFGKFKAVFPYTTIGIVLVWLIDAVKWHLTGVGILKWLLYLPTNILLLYGFGVQSFGFPIQEGVEAPRLIDPHLWYICCMLVALLFAAFLFQYLKKGKALVFSIVPLILYGMLILADGSVNGWHDAFLGFFASDLRALAGLLAGAASWHIGQWLRKKSVGSGVRLLLTLVEILSFLFVFITAAFTDLPFDFLWILLLFLSVSLSVSELTYTCRCDLGFFRLLGKVSLPVYCLQTAVMLALGGFFPQHHNVIVCAVTIAAGFICLFVVEGVKKLLAKRKAA